MLTLTTDASTAVASIVARADANGSAGLRIANDGADQNGFVLSVAEAPQEADVVVDAGPAKVFLDEQANIALDDKLLDAQIDAEGGVQFALVPQPA